MDWKQEFKTLLGYVVSELITDHIHQVVDETNGQEGINRIIRRRTRKPHRNLSNILNV